MIATPPKGYERFIWFEWGSFFAPDLGLKFNPDQPRDESGKWTDGGGSASSGWTEDQLREKFREEGISDNDKTMIRTFTRMGTGYDEINAYLRGKKTEHPDAPAIHRLNDTLARSELERPVEVWRGLQSDKHKFNVGDTITMKGFQSASLDKHVVGDRRPGAVLKITTTKGLYVEAASAHPDEKEFLLGHNWKYKVTGTKDMMIPAYERGPSPYKVYELDVIGTHLDN